MDGQEEHVWDGGCAILILIALVTQAARHVS